ncbi:MAG: hypothetical protein IKN71_03940 [Alphaproteobacteria bacterium]|nr:hypothetical protein [Alphaproteobacteria bacterium]
MKKIIHLFLGFLFVALLAIFAVALLGRAIQGNPYAIVLSITELTLVIIPIFIDERKLPHWVSSLWTTSLCFWFVCTIIWIAHELGCI